MTMDWTAIRKAEGYLPIEDHGVIGDGATAALVGCDGTVSWLCIPRFDSPPLFSAILDAPKGGFFAVAPEGATSYRQYYLEDTPILVTELQGLSGTIRITDAMTVHRGADLSEGVAVARNELIRMVEALAGDVEVGVKVTPRGGAEIAPCGGGFRLRWNRDPSLRLYLCSTALTGGVETSFRLRQGERTHLVLRWGEGSVRYHPEELDQIVEDTVAAWRNWVGAVRYNGPQQRLVRRSAITLKVLDYFPTGALVAAPTSSLPEVISGSRNWDYRYAWVRDTALSVYALRRIDLTRTAEHFLTWVLDAIETYGRPSVLYELHGGKPPKEVIDQELEGYRRSGPVRWGNAAAAQVQHDVYGEIVDCAYQWARGGGRMDPALWEGVKELVEAAKQKWQTPDHGIWEVRTAARPFTYSVALCHVALDRGALLAETYSLPGDVAGWRAEAAKIREAILHEAWDPGRRSLTEHIGGGGLDASLLTLPLRRVVPADHPKMAATTEAIRRELSAGHGLLYRYLRRKSPDGLPGEEGAFLLCSFWLVDNLAKQGRSDEAHALFESLCGRVNHLGLLPEEIDPSTGSFLGNFPQAFSHVGLISSGVCLSRLR